MSLTMNIVQRGMLYLLILLTSCMFGLEGCSGNGGQDLFETAQFEERQNNHAHARELYQQIITEYPDSEYAQKAQDRLAQLDAAP